MSRTSRECLTILLHHLNCLDPRRNVANLHLLLQLFTSVDITSHSKVADWLAPSFGWSISQKMVQTAMRRMLCPIKILVPADGRPCLTCSSIMDESSSDTSGSSDYIQVPFISEDCSYEGFTPSVIHEGDLVRLRCLSSVTWLVFAILQKENKVILAVNNRNQSTGTPKLGANRILSEEKRCFYPSDFLGAVVWTEILVRKPTDYSEECSLEISTDDFNLLEGPAGFTSSTSCTFQMPFIPWNRVLQSILLLVKEESLYLKEESVKIKAPTYHSSSKISARKSSGSDSLSASVSTRSASTIRKESVSPFIDNYISGGYHAQAQMWIRRQKDVREARYLLWGSDPFSCCLSSCRDRWILTCRALRSLCRGGDDLLDDFYRWTKMAGVEGDERSKSCRSVWASLRPLTTSDLPCVVRARVYARACTHANQEEEGVEERMHESSAGFSYRSIEARCKMDPTLKSFLSAASAVLSDRSLYFLSSVHDSDVAIANHPAGAVYVPAAVYECSPPCNVVSDSQEERKIQGFDDAMQTTNQNEVDAITPSKLVRTTETIACISPGNVLLLPVSPSDCPKSWQVPVSNDRSSSSSSSSSLSSTSSTLKSKSSLCTWHRVVAVDLFYARIRVSPCPPPPDCWNRHVTLPSVWAPISLLWATTICQIIPCKEPQWTTIFEYLIYVTPIPSRVASLAALASLPRKDVYYSESSEVRSKVRQKKMESKAKKRITC